MTPLELHITRRLRKLTQEQLAQYLGITRATLGRYERGTRKITKLFEIAVTCVIEHKLKGQVFKSKPQD